MTIFAIDLGNKQTKMTDGQHTYIYPSSLLQARKVDVELYPVTKPPGILAKLKSKKASNNVLMTNNVFFIKAPFSFKDITSIH